MDTFEYYDWIVFVFIRFLVLDRFTIFEKSSDTDLLEKLKIFKNILISEIPNIVKMVVLK